MQTLKEIEKNQNNSPLRKTLLKSNPWFAKKSILELWKREKGFRIGKSGCGIEDQLFSHILRNYTESKANNNQVYDPKEATLESLGYATFLIDFQLP